MDINIQTMNLDHEPEANNDQIEIDIFCEEENTLNVISAYKKIFHRIYLLNILKEKMSSIEIDSEYEKYVKYAIFCAHQNKRIILDDIDDVDFENIQINKKSYIYKVTRNIVDLEINWISAGITSLKLCVALGHPLPAAWDNLPVHILAQKLTELANTISRGAIDLAG